ncbi:prefoldin subunit 5 [Leptopilina heterotoma]|uniref:prefoldin subunit 5 n=1 Tax=Leptopilina heterotoma TaxID=63436 RepID=UPI001CAA263E|nr:prefoldin subunit 5 [Leptopilina heterotoma]
MSQISLTEQPNLQEFDLTKLNLQQLSILKQQLDQDISMFQESLQTLKIAQTKFQESGSCMDKITPETKGKEILVPLTGSMYVAGQMGETKTVLVDIGTGYFVEKNIDEAKTYFQNRVTYVSQQMQNIQQMGIEKSKVRETIVELLEMKLQAMNSKEVAERT